ncbi:MAG: metalloregulator ArsR/SmtB family transcription factor [Bacilli bacterium]|jgi:ArsR family transcriptional regulator
MEYKKACELYKILGDESRLEIVRLLQNTGEMCACNFLQFVKCGQATLSHHLDVLAKADLVYRRREGTRILYRANSELINDLMKVFDTEKAKAGDAKCNTH